MLVTRFSLATISLGAALLHAQADITPVIFEPNQGQVSGELQWLGRGPGYRLSLTNSGAILAMAETRAAGSTSLPSRMSRTSSHRPMEKTKYTAVKMSLFGSRNWSASTGLQPTGGHSNYLLGNDPQKWHTDVPHYAQVKVAGVYEGIDLVFYGANGGLEYDLVVAPGADPSQIQMEFEGASSIRIDSATGDLVLGTPGGREMRQGRPHIYQQVGSRRVEVQGGYQLSSQGRATFNVSNYDAERPLVIDPTISWKTFLAGSFQDEANAVAVDTSGNSYTTGITESTDFPVTAGALETNGGNDAFVTKLSSTGQYVFSTFLGGGSADSGNGIAVDSTGVYITGTTYSRDFPTKNAFLPLQGLNDAFVTKLTLAGNSLVYSTFLGGNYGFGPGPGTAYTQGNAIAVDPTGAAYVVGVTNANDFLTLFAFQPSLPAGNPNWHAFVAKIAPSGFNLMYSSYLGGSGYDEANAVAVDANGSAFVSGITCSPNFPVQGAAVQGYPGGCAAFVTRFAPIPHSLIFSTYVGGATSYTWFPFGNASFYPGPTGIAIDGSGSAYVTGTTFSYYLPTTLGAFQPHKPTPDTTLTAFVTKLSGQGTVLYSTYLGATSGHSIATSIAVDPAGEAYAAGYTTSTTFPGAAAGFAPSPTAGYVTKLTASGNAVSYTTILGTRILGVAVLQPASGPAVIVLPKVYTVGYRMAQAEDAFVVKIDEGTRLIGLIP